MKPHLLFLITLLTCNATLEAQINNPTTYHSSIEPGIGYVYKTGNDHNAMRFRLDIRNVVFKNRMGFYYTFEQKSRTAVGKYKRDIAGINYSLNKNFAVHAGAGLLSEGIITDGIRFWGLRKEIGVTYRVDHFPLTIIMGYSWAIGPTTTIGYSIPVEIDKSKRLISFQKNETVKVEEKIKENAQSDTMVSEKVETSNEIIETTTKPEPPNSKPTIDIKKLCEESKSYFPYKVSSVSEVDKSKMIALSNYLKENPRSLISIYGSTDNVGSEKYNMELSLSRANNAKEYLISLGVPAERISVIPLGMTKSRNAVTAEEKAAARNVSFEIYNP